MEVTADGHSELSQLFFSSSTPTSAAPIKQGGVFLFCIFSISSDDMAPYVASAVYEVRRQIAGIVDNLLDVKVLIERSVL